MSEKDVVYVLQMLHVIQSKKNAIAFVEYLDKNFSQLTKEKKDKLYQKYLNQNKDDENNN
jgi:hypothetical protein